MQVSVFDTYATSKTGETIHFDVLVPTDASPEKAYDFAVEWLKVTGLASADLQQSRCNFCHIEQAGETVASDIHSNGYSIIQMEGCPNPA